MTSEFKIACLQLRSGRQPAENYETTAALIREAAAGGAQFIVTPEMTNAVDLNAKRLLSDLKGEADAADLKAYRRLAGELGVWLLLGSLAVKLEERLAANRSYLIDDNGAVVATYDKIHMFDVDLDGGESYRESSVYRPGDEAVLVETPWGGLGLTICYDLRFPDLYRRLARAGASMIAVPAAFTQQTGEAHWHALLRARAIENGAFVFAPAQGGTHDDGRETYGHSLIIDPWGKVIAEKDDAEPGIVYADIDPEASERARRRIPNLNLEVNVKVRTFS